MKRLLVLLLTPVVVLAAARPAQATFHRFGRGSHIHVGFFGHGITVVPSLTPTVAPPVLVGPLTPTAPTALISPVPNTASISPVQNTGLADPGLAGVAAQLQQISARLAALEARQTAAALPVLAQATIVQFNTLPAVQQFAFLTRSYGLTAGRALFVGHGGALGAAGLPTRAAVFVRAPFVRLRIR